MTEKCNPRQYMYQDHKLEESMKRDCSTCARGGLGGDLCLNCKSEKYENWESKNTARPAATPEPMSKPGKKDVFPELIKDIEARRQVGIKTYGYPLQTFNGRDALNDALQESIDQCLYIKQAIMERDDSDSFELWEKKIRKWADDRDLYANVTPYSQLKKMIEECVEWAEEAGDGPATESEKLEIGDMLVVLTNIAGSRGVNLWECGMKAYEKIKDRKGKIINGTFVKDK